MLNQFDIESDRVNEYEKIGCAKHLGHFDKLSNMDIKSSVVELINNYEIRKNMSNRGKKLIDGKGAERIINNLPKEFFS